MANENRSSTVIRRIEDKLEELEHLLDEAAEVGVLVEGTIQALDISEEGEPKKMASVIDCNITTTWPPPIES